MISKCHKLRIIVVINPRGVNDAADETSCYEFCVIAIFSLVLFVSSDNIETNIWVFANLSFDVSSVLCINVLEYDQQNILMGVAKPTVL